MVRDIIFGSLALLSLVLWLWQWFAARRFPLHRHIAGHAFPPAVTLLKPLKGCEPGTSECLRSWFEQDYTGRVQILFGIAAPDDPVCEVVRGLQGEFKHVDSSLIICSLIGANAKVSKLLQLEQQAKHELVIISDADVRVPADFLANFVEPLRSNQKARDEQSKKSSERACGLVNCFYRLANPTTVAMQWEAICINADFWSQVLQSRSLKPLDFALGAVMGTRRALLKEIGGFEKMVDCLADDYELGNRIARLGYQIEICTVVVDCVAAPMGWQKVWNHQLRWARTIRVSQPVPYFFSVLSNPTLWPLLWLLVHPHPLSATACIGCCALRIVGALDLQQRMTQSRKHFVYWWLTPIKDLLQTSIWLLAFVGNRIEWRGQSFRLRRDGTMEKIS